MDKKNCKATFRIRYNKPVFKEYNHRAITCFISANIQTASDVLGKFRVSAKDKAVVNLSDGDEFNVTLGKKLALLRAKIKIESKIKKAILSMSDYVNTQNDILREDSAYTSYSLSKLNSELKSALEEIKDAETK
jgi:hypothetical protein